MNFIKNKNKNYKKVTITTKTDKDRKNLLKRFSTNPPRDNFLASEPGQPEKGRFKPILLI
jgi:hypothetical protein